MSNPPADARIVGDFFEPRAASTSVELELRPSEFLAQWARCGLTADWLASYLACDFAPSEKSELKNVLSTVINELVENAVKFSLTDQSSARIAARRYDDCLLLETWNAAEATRARMLEDTLANLTPASADALLTGRIAAGGPPEAPGIGLLIIKRDYGAKLGAAVTLRPDGAHDVHLTVELRLADMERR